MRIKTLTLTGNDVALAEAGAQLAIAWQKEHNGRGQWSRTEQAKYSALIRKLSAILDLAHPAGCYDDGEDQIVATVPAVLRATRARSRKLAKERDDYE